MSPLSSHELGSRRTTWHRRRTRRRIGLAVLIALVLAAIPAVALTRGHGRHHPATVASATPVIPAPVAGSRRASSARAHPSSGNPDRSLNKVLSYTSYVRLGAGARRDVALTFDDGPGPYTSAIIRILRRAHASATFFAIGREVGLYPGLIATEARDGFEIGDHTESHPFMAALSPVAQETQIAAAAGAIRRVGGPAPRLFRPPYGSFNAGTLEVLRALHMLMVLWTVDTSDYARPGVARIVYVALSGARPGAIILMHDGGGDRVQTVDALPRIIRGLRRHGYRLVTVSQLVADDPPPRHQRGPTPLSGAG